VAREAAADLPLLLPSVAAKTQPIRPKGHTLSLNEWIMETIG